jgi:acetyl esterase/lipase
MKTRRLSIAFAKTFLLIVGSVVAFTASPATAQNTSDGKPIRFLWANRHAPLTSPKASNLPDTTTYAKTDTTRNSWLAEYIPSGTKNGAAMIVIPGGGYDNLSPWGSEGRPAATTLTGYGIHVFILHYRLKPYGYPYAMWDVQRAVRWVRANAATYGIDANRIGVLGYSAGGHVASTATTHFDAGLTDSNATNGPHWFPGAKDSIDLVSSRPNFSGLIYPMTTMVRYVPNTTTDFAYKPGRDIYIGTSPAQSLVDYTSNEKQVSPQTPPAFINWGTSDNVVLPLNSTAYRDSLISKGVKYKTVIVSGGGHSPSTAKLDSLRTWLNTEGFLLPSVAIRPGRARILPPAHALRPGDAPDALGRLSIRPTGQPLKVPTVASEE